MAGTDTFSQGVTLLGAGVAAASELVRALLRAPHLIAVDGGADAALAMGHMPARVIGDMDSISPAARARLADRLEPVPSQDDTDFDKALDRVDAPLLLALGFTGGRLDHTLAAMSGLMRRPDRRAVIWAEDDICFLTPPRMELALPAGSRLSLYPLAPVTCASRGLVWPTEGLELAPGAMIGTSNRVADGELWLEPAAPALLCLVPVDALDAVIAGLSRAPAWQPSARVR